MNSRAELIQLSIESLRAEESSRSIEITINTIPDIHVVSEPDSRFLRKKSKKSKMLKDWEYKW